jgi:outer membrane protein assembly factor BamE
MRVLPLLVSCILASGCGPFVYKIDVQQGNYITQDAVAKLKPGMTKAEVRQVLGTPLLNDVFHADRWDYYYSNAKGGRGEDRKRFTVLFREDKVVSFSGEAQPPAPPPVGATAPVVRTPAAAASPAAATPSPAPAPAPAPAPPAR